MKTHLIFIYCFVNLAFVLKGQSDTILDKYKIQFIYEFALNQYLTNIGSLGAYVNSNTNVPIANNYIIISTSEIKGKQYSNFIKRFNYYYFDKKMHLYGMTNFDKLHSLYKVKTKKIIDNKKWFLDFKCRASISFTDIYQNNNKYYLGIYAIANADLELQIKEVILFEFEICKNNGFVSFKKAFFKNSLSLEESEETPQGNLSIDFKNYCPCESEKKGKKINIF